MKSNEVRKCAIYLVMRQGCEGIETLCWLTDSPREAIKKKHSFARGEMVRRIKQDKRLEKELPDIFKGHEKRHQFGYYLDMMCIQKWDGAKFVCVCGELGDPPSRVMFR